MKLLKYRLQFSVLAAKVRDKVKKARSLSPTSGALRRIGAIADEERSGPQSDRPSGEQGAYYPCPYRKLYLPCNAFIWRALDSWGLIWPKGLSFGKLPG